MINLTEKKNCCGCSACVQSCPQKCISMLEDEEGFLYPRVREEDCIHCGLCTSLCPVSSEPKKEPDFLQCYIASAKEESLKLNSSSGGLFPLLAGAILNSGGVVFGAAFDTDWTVHHVCCRTQKELFALQGSKYLQSRIENTYAEALQYLKQDVPVLFSGTPCQIAGLKNFLKTPYPKLYTVDILCHGVPSAKVWQSYLKSQKDAYHSEPVFISFRNKSEGWKKYKTCIQFQNGQTYLRPFEEDDFMKVFLKDICLRPSCHDCHFKGLHRPSDLTLGDCWSVNTCMPKMNDKMGTSVVFLHSEKGKQLFTSVSSALVAEPARPNLALPPDADSRKSVRPHPQRTDFFLGLNQGKTVHELTEDYGLTLFHRPSIKERIQYKLKKLSVRH